MQKPFPRSVFFYIFSASASFRKQTIFRRPASPSISSPSLSLVIFEWDEAQPGFFFFFCNNMLVESGSLILSWRAIGYRQLSDESPVSSKLVFHVSLLDGAWINSLLLQVLDTLSISDFISEQLEGLFLTFRSRVQRLLREQIPPWPCLHLYLRWTSHAKINATSFPSSWEKGDDDGGGTVTQPCPTCREAPEEEGMTVWVTHRPPLLQAGPESVFAVWKWMSPSFFLNSTHSHLIRDNSLKGCQIIHWRP